MVSSGQTRDRLCTAASIPDGDIAAFAMSVSNVLPSPRQLLPTLYQEIYCNYIIQLSILQIALHLSLNLKFMLYIFNYDLYVVIMYKHFYCHIIDK